MRVLWGQPDGMWQEGAVMKPKTETFSASLTQHYSNKTFITLLTKKNPITAWWCLHLCQHLLLTAASSCLNVCVKLCTRRVYIFQLKTQRSPLVLCALKDKASAFIWSFFFFFLSVITAKIIAWAFGEKNPDLRSHTFTDLKKGWIN